MELLEIVQGTRTARPGANNCLSLKYQGYLRHGKISSKRVQEPEAGHFYCNDFTPPIYQTIPTGGWTLLGVWKLGYLFFWYIKRWGPQFLISLMSSIQY